MKASDSIFGLLLSRMHGGKLFEQAAHHIFQNDVKIKATGITKKAPLGLS
jgi:hypothetical protein